MPRTSSGQFGLTIAYLLPGFIALIGTVPHFPMVAAWLQAVPSADFDFELGPPLYCVLAATALGLILSCFRFLLVENLHALMGVRRPIWEDRELDRVLDSFDYLVQAHFRYYEFCGNTLLALLWSYGVNRALGTLPGASIASDLAIVVVLAVLFFASRSALMNYYSRTSRLIGGWDSSLERHVMFNGNDHGSQGGGHSPAPSSKPQQQPKANPPKPKPAPASPRR